MQKVKALDPTQANAPNRGVMVPHHDAKRLGEKWECGARDPNRGAKPQPPPRL